MPRCCGAFASFLLLLRLSEHACLWLELVALPPRTAPSWQEVPFQSFRNATILIMSCTGRTSPCSVKRIAGERSHFAVRSAGSDLLREMHIGTSSVTSGQKSRAKACNASLADSMKRVGHSTFVVLSRTQGRAPDYLCG